MTRGFLDGLGFLLKDSHEGNLLREACWCCVTCSATKLSEVFSRRPGSYGVGSVKSKRPMLTRKGHSWAHDAFGSSSLTVHLSETGIL